MNNFPYILVVLIFWLNPVLFAQPMSKIQILKQESKEQKKNPDVHRKFTRAKSLEKAGLWEEAEQLYREINTELPGNSRYFLPLKNILKQRREWDTLIEFTKHYSLAKQNDIQSKIDLAEVYIWADSLQKSREIFHQILNRKPINSNYAKLVINKLAQNALFDEADSLIGIVRVSTRKPDFYALEMGRYYASRMVYDKALSEYLLYLSKNPTRLDFVSGKIVGFPDNPLITELVTKELKKSVIPESKVILADIHYKHKEYRKSYNLLNKKSIETRFLLDFATDLITEDQFNLAEEVFTNLLHSSSDSHILEKAIFNLAVIFEKKTITDVDPLPISGFFKDNSFFKSPFMKLEEKQAESLWQAIHIYDSLLTATRSVEANYRLGEIRYRILGDLDGAARHFENIINNRRNTKLVKESIFRLVDVHIAKGDLQSAQDVLLEYQSDHRLKKFQTNVAYKQAQVYFYQGELDTLTTHLKNELNSLSLGDEQFNDILEIRSLLAYFHQSPEWFTPFSEVQLLLQQNKREEALDKLKLLLESSDPTLVELTQYQIAYLLVLQGDITLALEITELISGESMYSELAIILNGEISDYLLGDTEKAIDYYLEFLETYPTSIYYDRVRMRLRELAS